jgi:hypothetical protein
MYKALGLIPSTGKRKKERKTGWKEGRKEEGRKEENKSRHTVLDVFQNCCFSPLLCLNIKISIMYPCLGLQVQRIY